jgi:hypothetical protein
MRAALPWAFAAAALFYQCTALRAECIIPPPPCEALKQVSVVALVDVVDAIGPGEQPNRFGERFMRHDARLRIVERFKGIPADQNELSISIPFNAETTVLSKGKTYLVYAFVDTAGDWQTSCTRTKVSDADDEEVRILRQCK